MDEGDGKYDVSLSETPNRYKVSSVSATNVILEHLVWHFGKDNADKGKEPIFQSQHFINVTLVTPYQFFWF